MKILELFAWSRSIWNEADKMWFKVFSTDLKVFEKIDYNVDILEFDYTKVDFIPDMIWASPPCTTYSIASCFYHRKPWNFTQEAILWDKIVLKTLEIIDYYLKLNPNLVWYIENPTWLLRKQVFMQNIWILNEITYCSYWFNIMKPTDIWTNNNKWKPKTKCKNHKYDKEWNQISTHCHHEWARRWSSTWTQWKLNAYERSKIPSELCIEILKAS